MSGPCVVSGQCVHSHNYPGLYANHEHCTLQPVDGQPLRVKAFNTEERFDFLTINGVRYSGYGHTQVVWTLQGLWLSLKSRRITITAAKCKI